MFGYVTATLATFFVDRDAENEESEIAGQGAINQMRDEVANA
jgi:voltage-gated potassium channel